MRPSVRKIKQRGCGVCARYAALYAVLLEDHFWAIQPPKALVSVAAARRARRGRPAAYLDHRLHARGVRETVTWVHHVRSRGGPHLSQVPGAILRPLAERILVISNKTPRYGDRLLAYLALKRLVDWKAPTGRYGRVVYRLYRQWKREGDLAWSKTPVARVVKRLLFNQEIKVKSLKPVKQLAQVWRVPLDA